MASSFKSLDLFGSGPHRLIEGPAGQDMVPRLRLGMSLSGSTSIGDAQLAVTVTGRLVGSDDADVHAHVDAIKAQLALWETPGKLIDHHGREWPSLNFVRFEPADRIDRGRETSLGYVAAFMQL